MNRAETLFLRCIRLSSHPEEVASFTDADRAETTDVSGTLCTLAEKHSLISGLYEGLCLLDIPLNDEERRYYRDRVTAGALSCYHMLSFTRKILHILETEHINYFLLKGVSLLECYPKLELRPFGDMDILVPAPGDFERLKKHLLSCGFYTESSFTEHHLEMYYSEQGRKFLLEIHHKVIAGQANSDFNRQVKKIFDNISPQTRNFPAARLNYQTLPVTENALYLLLHMLQHFLGSGFGIKLLWDWTAYLERHGEEIEQKKFLSYLKKLGLTRFCHTMTSLCRRYMGLDIRNLTFLTGSFEDSVFLEAFMSDIFDAGTFGKTDNSRMLIMSGGGKLSRYFKELHRQMKKRFQRLCSIPVLWPILWVMTGICFLWNNYFVRKTKTSEILANARERQNLIDELALFQRGDDSDER